jgi:MFS family permease
MNTFLVVNTFVWYFFAFTVLRNLVENANLSYIDALIIWTLNFGGAAVSALSSTKIAGWFKQRVLFIHIWLFIGFLSSLTPIFMNVTTMNLSVISFLYGVSFGLGMPICMEYFAEATTIENRGRFGGISFFIIALGVFLLSILSIENFFVEVLISAAWRGFGLLALLFVKPIEKSPLEKRDTPSYISILNRREFLFYIIPWWMFCLVNYTSLSIVNKFFGEDFIRFSSVVELILMSAFAVVAGYLADAVGRKRVAIAGFAMLGLGYAVLGIYPGVTLSWYFYTVVDGIAWGIFYVIFLIVLWGDLAHDTPSGNFYVLGGLPFLLSNFLQIIIGSYIAETVSVYTIFSLASFFLFLAVFPLMYAPETLPEKKIRERELKGYIDKAKKVKEKYT